jgi:hypothetical protein
MVLHRQKLQAAGVALIGPAMASFSQRNVNVPSSSSARVTAGKHSAHRNSAASFVILRIDIVVSLRVRGHIREAGALRNATEVLIPASCSCDQARNHHIERD